jgi:hypothetical protein
MVRMALALAMTTLTASPPATAIPERFNDPEDGAFDLSDYLLRHRGVLPVPIVITEPAVGYGGGVGLAYFSQSFAESAEAARARGERVQPPDITAAAGIKTENGTWGAGFGYLGFFDQDRWRYRGAYGTAQLNLDYYSVRGDPRAYRLDADATAQVLLRRIGDSHWFAGASYLYFSSESRFVAGVPDDVPARALDSSIGKLGLVIDYDSRDNIFTPNRGTFFELDAGFARGALGSKANFEMVNARAYSWHPAGDFVLGMRGDVRLSTGDVPFYAQPYISLRGVPAARYQDRNALVIEFEARWNLDGRWALVGFAGAGKAYGRRQAWADSETVVSLGAGFRYLVARKLNLYAGLDVARGPEEGAVYFQVGSAWQ